MRRSAPLVALLCGLVAAQGAAARGFAPVPQRLGGSPNTIVGVRPGAGFMAAPVLGRAGGVAIAPSAGLWEVPTHALRRTLPALRSARLVQLVEPVHPLRREAARVIPDPLSPEEWWRAHVGADAAEPPGPGVPLTIVDTGVDLSHPEFAGRPNTTALNQQRVTDTEDDFHGTAVASVAAAPANGVGTVGVYPQAVLRVFDADLQRQLDDAQLIRGIDEAASSGRGVINVSLGGPDYSPALQLAIDAAFRRGSLIVAASGNTGDTGNARFYPANMSHVLTVAATDWNDDAASFSSSSVGVDLAAPGVDIPAAIPTSYYPAGFQLVAGTSFAAPIVAGAAAWVWTVRSSLDNTQLFDLMRWSARDVGARGFDIGTGFGVVDIPSALSRTPPLPDPSEPNDDVGLVKPGALFASGMPPLTTATRGRASLRARLDVADDPDDVYRVWIPAHRRVTITVRGNANVDLEAWKPGTRTIGETGAASKRDLAARSQKTGTRADSVVVANATSRGAFYYADFFPGRGVGDADYRLTVATR